MECSTGMTFKGGKYQKGWGILERGLLALSTVAVTAGKDRIDELKASVSKQLADDAAPSSDIRNRTAREISRRAQSLPGRDFSGSRIEMALTRANHEILLPLLEEISTLLAPKSPDNQAEISDHPMPPTN